MVKTHLLLPAAAIAMVLPVLPLLPCEAAAEGPLVISSVTSGSGAVILQVR